MRCVEPGAQRPAGALDTSGSVRAEDQIVEPQLGQQPSQSPDILDALHDQNESLLLSSCGHVSIIPDPSATRHASSARSLVLSIPTVVVVRSERQAGRRVADRQTKESVRHRRGPRPSATCRPALRVIGRLTRPWAPPLAWEAGRYRAPSYGSPRLRLTAASITPPAAEPAIDTAPWRNRRINPRASSFASPEPSVLSTASSIAVSTLESVTL